jgi:hypothetical protein
MKFPIEVGPPRKVVYNVDEYLKFINTNNGLKKAIYHTIYKFDVINGKRPDYNTALVDCLFFDFDDKSCNAYENCFKLHKHLQEINIKHSINMSGRGYHLYIYTNPYKPNNVKSTIKNAQMYFINKLNLSVDTQVIGNPAQMARIANTFNSKANLFCIPLTIEDLKGDDFIKNKAKKQNFIKEIFIGKEYFELKDFDYKTEDENIFEIVDFDDEEFILDIEKIPICIKNLLKQKDVGWKGRYLIIIYFRDKGYSINEIAEILKKCLSPSKYNHCVNEERQLQYLFNRHDLIFPNCDKIIYDGYCTKKCVDYGKIIYKNI